jgi:hypothetical protein
VTGHHISVVELPGAGRRDAVLAWMVYMHSEPTLTAVPRCGYRLWRDHGAVDAQQATTIQECRHARGRAAECQLCREYDTPSGSSLQRRRINTRESRTLFPQ